MPRCVVIADRSPDPSREEIRSADLVVPLFLEGAASLGELGERVAFPTELFSEDRRRGLADRALRCRNRFLELACGGETLDGIDVPAVFLTDELLLTFREILFGQELGRALAERSIHEATWISAAAEDGTPVAEACSRGLAAFLGPDVELERVAGESHRRTQGRSFLDRLSYPYRKVKNRWQAGRAGRSRCRRVAVFPGGHWQRFRNAIEDLGTRQAWDFQVWYLGRAGSELRSWLGDLGIEISNIPYPGRVDLDVDGFFDRHQSRWRAEGLAAFAREVESPVLTDPRVSDLLDPYFALVFRRTAQWARALREALDRADPELVVGSAAFTYATALPFHVARVQGRPSLALSHTHVSGDHSPVAATYLACRNRFEREGYRRSFPDDSKTLICGNASDELTYRVSKKTVLGGAGEQRIIALLTAAPHFHQYAMPLHEDGESARCLRALSQPPGDLRSYSLVWKSHPRFNLTPLLGQFDLASNVRIFPETASVTELIESSWLCVLVNHFGGVAVDVAAAGRPLVFLDSAGYHYPNADPSSLEAMATVRGVDELWKIVRTLGEDEERYDEMVARSRAFRKQWLATGESSLSRELDAHPVLGARR